MKEILNMHANQLEKNQEENEKINEMIRNFNELKKENLEINARIIEIKKQENPRNPYDLYREEYQNMKNEFKEMSKKVTSLILKDDNLKIEELQKTINGIQNELALIKNSENDIEFWKSQIQENLIQLSSNVDNIKNQYLTEENKGFNTQIIDDLQNEILKVKSEVNLAEKKINSLEELLTTQRRELFSNVSEIEGYFIARMESLKRTMQEMAIKCDFQITE